MFFPPHYLYFLILSLYNSNDTIFPLSVSYNALHVQQIKDKLSLGHWYIPVLWKVPDYSQYIISKHLWKDGSDSGCRENPDSLDIDVFLILQDGNPLFEVYLSNNYGAFRKKWSLSDMGFWLQTHFMCPEWFCTYSVPRFACPR